MDKCLLGIYLHPLVLVKDDLFHITPYYTNVSGATYNYHRKNRSEKGKGEQDKRLSLSLALSRGVRARQNEIQGVCQA